MAFPVDRIRAHCKAAGITIAELERELGFGNAAIARWENNKTAPPIDRLQAIADRFGVTVAELAGEQPANNDGLTAEQTELIRLVRSASPAEIAVLLAAAKAQVKARQAQGEP